MVHNQDCRALIPQFNQNIADHLFTRGVDTREGLIQQIQIRLLCQNTGHKHPTALATRQFGNLTLSQIRNANILQIGGHQAFLLGRHAAKPAQLGVQAHGHHLLNRDGVIPIHIGGLRHISHPVTAMRQRLAKKTDITTLKGNEVNHRFNDR